MPLLIANLSKMYLIYTFCFTSLVWRHFGKGPNGSHPLCPILSNGSDTRLILPTISAASVTASSLASPGLNTTEASVCNAYNCAFTNGQPMPTIYGWVPSSYTYREESAGGRATVTSTMTVLAIIDHQNTTSLSTQMPTDYETTINAAGTQIRTLTYTRLGQTSSTVL